MRPADSPVASSRPPRHACRGEANWTAGPLSGTTRFAYDYDGMKTITLELAPTETEVERVQLVIPLKASEAWLMHPVTTTLRHHFAGRIPALRPGSGKGKVWDSSQAHDRLNGTFVPYIYLGGPERGICFAADNDRDWITDKDTPMMVIDREGETVQPAAQPDRQTVAPRPARAPSPSPCRPRPPSPCPRTPYNWRRWWANTRTETDIDRMSRSTSGAATCTGAGDISPPRSIPAFKDYGFWEQLAESRRTGKRDRRVSRSSGWRVSKTCRNRTTTTSRLTTTPG